MFEYAGLGIRPVEASDLELLKFSRNEQSTWQNLTDIDMINGTQQSAWFSRLSEDKTRSYFIVCKSDLPVGMIRITDINYHNSTACVGCDVFPEHRGRGHGQNIMSIIKQYCFKWLNLRMLWLLVSADNLVAEYIYEKVGFKKTGCLPRYLYRDGAYVDYNLMVCENV